MRRKRRNESRKKRQKKIFFHNYYKLPFPKKKNEIKKNPNRTNSNWIIFFSGSIKKHKNQNSNVIHQVITTNEKWKTLHNNIYFSKQLKLYWRLCLYKPMRLSVCKKNTGNSDNHRCAIIVWVLLNNQ